MNGSGRSNQGWRSPLEIDGFKWHVLILSLSNDTDEAIKYRLAMLTEKVSSSN